MPNCTWIQSKDSHLRWFQFNFFFCSEGFKGIQMKFSIEELQSLFSETIFKFFETFENFSCHFNFFYNFDYFPQHWFQCFFFIENELISPFTLQKKLKCFVQINLKSISLSRSVYNVLHILNDKWQNSSSFFIIAINCFVGKIDEVLIKMKLDNHFYESVVEVESSR